MSLVVRLRNSSLASGAAIYMASSIINSAIPFFLLPVLTRYLNPTEYGEVAIFQVWVALMGAVCGLSVHGAAVRKYYDSGNSEAKIGAFNFACLMVLCFSTGIVLILLLPLASLLSDVIGLSEAWLFVGVVFAFCNFVIQIRLGQWQVRKKPKYFGIFQISMSLLNAALSLILVVVFALGVFGRLSGQTASVALFALLALFILRRDGLIKISWQPRMMVEALKFGVPLIPHVIGAFLLITADRAVIGSKLGLEQAGYYMVALQFAMVMNFIIDGVNKAYTPWLYERLSRGVIDDKVRVVKITYLYGLFLALCVVLAFVVGEVVLVFVAGEAFKPAAHLVGWMVLAKAFHGMYYMVSGFIFYTKRTALVAKITISTGLLNIGLLLMLSEYFGIIGAAWAMCASMFLQWMFAWVNAAKLVEMPWLLR